MNIYSLIYIATYDFFLMFRKKDDPEFRAVIGFSMYFRMNLILLSFLFGIPEIISNIMDAKVFYIAFMVLIIAINYFLFVFNHTYKRMHVEFSKKHIVYRKNLRWLSLFLMVEGLLAPKT